MNGEEEKVKMRVNWLVWLVGLLQKNLHPSLFHTLIKKRKKKEEKDGVGPLEKKKLLAQGSHATAPPPSFLFFLFSLKTLYTPCHETSPTIP